MKIINEKKLKLINNNLNNNNILNHQIRVNEKNDKNIPLFPLK